MSRPKAILDASIPDSAPKLDSTRTLGKITKRTQGHCRLVVATSLGCRLKPPLDFPDGLRLKPPQHPPRRFEAWALVLPAAVRSAPSLLHSARHATETAILDASTLDRTQDHTTYKKTPMHQTRPRAASMPNYQTNPSRLPVFSISTPRRPRPYEITKRSQALRLRPPGVKSKHGTGRQSEALPPPSRCQ